MADPNKQNFVAGICSQCGAPLEVDPSKESGVCEYCGTKYVTSATINKYYTINNSNDTINVEYHEKKGIAQSAFEYMGKRAEARARERAESKAKAAALMEQQRLAEIEARERARIQEEKAQESKRRFWHGVGQFFLWLYFFPIMLIITLVRNSQQKKENEERMENGLEPKPSSMPVGLIVIGGLLFFSLFSSVIGGSSSGSHETDNNAPTATSIIEDVQQSPNPTVNIPQNVEEISSGEESEASKWYEKEPSSISNAFFSEETVTRSIGIFQYEVPKSWKETETEADTKRSYYPSASTFSYLLIECYNYDEVDYDQLSNEKKWVYLDVFVQLIEKNYSSRIKQTDTFPVILNDRRIAMIVSEFLFDETASSGWPVFFTVFPAHKQILVLTTVAGTQAGDISVDDLTALLLSIKIIE